MEDDSLVRDLKALMHSYKAKQEEYEALSKKETNTKDEEINRIIFKTKSETFGYTSKKIKDLLHWHGLL